VWLRPQPRKFHDAGLRRLHFKAFGVLGETGQDASSTSKGSALQSEPQTALECCSVWLRLQPRKIHEASLRGLHFKAFGVLGETGQDASSTSEGSALQSEAQTALECCSVWLRLQPRKIHDAGLRGLHFKAFGVLGETGQDASSTSAMTGARGRTILFGDSAGGPRYFSSVRSTRTATRKGLSAARLSAR
jgi:hypothetical protein